MHPPQGGLGLNLPPLQFCHYNFEPCLARPREREAAATGLLNDHRVLYVLHEQQTVRIGTLRNEGNKKKRVNCLPTARDAQRARQLTRGETQLPVIRRLCAQSQLLGRLWQRLAAQASEWGAAHCTRSARGCTRGHDRARQALSLALQSTRIITASSSCRLLSADF